jgi:hypothetical protein
MGFSDFYNFDGIGIGANYIDIFIWDREWSIEVGNNNVESHLACIAGQNGSPSPGSRPVVSRCGCIRTDE